VERFENPGHVGLKLSIDAVSFVAGLYAWGRFTVKLVGRIAVVGSARPIGAAVAVRGVSP
jgi:hypothetical protein